MFGFGSGKDDGDSDENSDGAEYEYVVCDEFGVEHGTHDEKNEAIHQAEFIENRYGVETFVDERVVDEDDGNEEDDTSEFQFLGDLIEPEREEAGDEDDWAVQRWSLGAHSMGEFGDTVGLLDELQAANEPVNDELAGLLKDAANLIARSTVSGFECPVCGLNHGHADDKHDIRSAFEVTERFANLMKFVPYCHCGANELAVLVDYIHYFRSQMFADQDEFASAVALDPELVDDVFRAYGGERSMRDAVKAAGYDIPTDVSSDEVAALEKLHYRRQRIKGVRAPISAETRTKIDEERARLEAVVADR